MAVATGSSISQNFAKAVRRRRLAGGWSQEALAEKAEVHATYVSMLERGVRKPTLEVADRLARALGVALADLIREAQAGRRKTGEAE